MPRILPLLFLFACQPLVVGGDDLDADGYAAEDCDDGDPEVHPDAEELCNGIDDNCDGSTDEGRLFQAFVDGDGDGYGRGEAILTCDLVPGQSASDDDCDDEDPAIHPDAVEACNDIDDDCDGEIDPDKGVYYQDDDGDGYGRDDTARETCAPEAGEVAEAGDCDDADPTIHPNALDACDDAIDTDCDARDLQCALGGEHLLSEAGTALIGANSWATGEYLAVGDLDGDDLEDIVMTTFYASNMQGGAAVVLGGATGEVSIADAGFRLNSSRSTTSAGRSVSVGDVNGDGFGDVAIGAADETCMMWVLYGPLTAATPLSDAAVIREGIANTEYGHGSSLADVNGDGLADLVVGAYEDDAGGGDAGAVFIEYAPFDAGTASAASTYDVRFIGDSSRDMAGRYIRTGPNADVDGDGIADMLIAAPYARGGAPSSGTLYLVRGGEALADMELSDADAFFLGEGSGEYAGEGQAFGDVNGDGLADLIIGSMRTVGNLGQAGAAYIVFGPVGAGGALGESDVIVYGSAAGQLFGLGLAASDINGDGADELLVGARGDNSETQTGGAAYLYWGPLSGTSTAAEADAAFLGEVRSGAAGTAVAFARFHHPSMSSLLIAAPYDSTGGSQAGAVYLFDYAE